MHKMSPLRISGTTRRVFLFPASLPETFAYYRDIGRSLGYLRHITTVQRFTPDQYRLVYSAKESILYRVKIFCDILAEADTEEYRIRILPLAGKIPVQSTVRINEMICQGSYTSEIVFIEHQGQTQVKTSIDIEAQLPKPAVLRLIPHALLSGAAHNIFLLRLDEVINGFIDQSILGYLLMKTGKS
jgi:hypothetical protein